MKINSWKILFAIVFCGALQFLTPSARSQTGLSRQSEAATNGYQIFVSNEKSGDLTVINLSRQSGATADGADFTVTATIPVGKRPRGIHASPDGKTVFVALSGTPIEPPPTIDANGNPVFEKKTGDADAEAKADKAADGIGVVDVAQKKFLRKISCGSDPEQFSLSADGKQLYISNEDVGTASVLDIASGKVAHIIPITQEPEGVTTSPDGKFFYVTCETAGDIFVVDTQTFKVIAHFNVHPRPRSTDFLPDSSRAFIPSESTGEMNLIDSVNHKPLQTIALPKGSRPMCVKVAPDGKKVYVSTGRGGSVCVLDAKTGDVLNTIKVGTRPWGIAISPDGKFLFAANGPSDDVSVVDLATEKEINRVKSPGSPWGVVIVPNTK
jgi:YVTN family beta-propeller protein